MRIVVAWGRCRTVGHYEFAISRTKSIKERVVKKSSFYKCLDCGSRFFSLERATGHLCNEKRIFDTPAI